MIGVSHRRGGASALEAYQRCFPSERLDGLRDRGVREWVLVTTCNRWDLFLSLSPQLDVEQARQLFVSSEASGRPYAYVADGALEQLTRVASSLDSLNPGEDQIMGQVREAFKEAQKRGTTGPDTSFAFNAALRIAKRVRREVALAPVNTSLFSLARPALEEALSGEGRVAVVGAGKLGSLAAKTVSAMPGIELVIVNRTLGRAEHLARHLSASCMPLSDFMAAPPTTHALVCATTAGGMIDGRFLDRLPELKMIVDLGVPRNVEESAGSQRGVPVLDVDTLQLAGRERREALAERLAQAEAIVREEIDAAVSEWTERQLGPSIKRLRSWYLAAIGDALPSDEAERLAKRLAHVPIKGLRAIARQHGLEAARTFLDETGLAE